MEGTDHKIEEHKHDGACSHDPKPTLCVAQLQFESFEMKGWHFYHSSYPMFSAK
jgi:hypothetical protein